MNKNLISIIMAGLLTVSSAALSAAAADVETESSTGSKGTFFFDTGDWNSTRLLFFIWDATTSTNKYATKDGWTDQNPWGSRKRLSGTLREELSGKDDNTGNVFESYEVELEPNHEYYVIFYDPDHGQTYDCCLSDEAFGDTAYLTGFTLQSPSDSNLEPLEAEFRNSGLGQRLRLTSYGTIVGKTLPQGINKAREVSSFVLKYLGKKNINSEDVVTTDILDEAYASFGVTADEVWEDYKKLPTDKEYAQTFESYKDNYNEAEAKKLIRPTVVDSDSDSDISSSYTSSSSTSSQHTTNRTSSSVTSSKNGTTSTTGKTTSDQKSTDKSTDTSSKNNSSVNSVTSPKTGGTTSLFGASLVLLSSTAAMMLLGKRKED